ncbi:hypothetical protein Btru_006829 [Bulinus truncatus]|nr:hypothetical protein Btru_006829 [Bulinus truncatus]
MTGKKLPGTSLPSKLASHLRRRRHSDTSLEGGEGVLEMMADLVTHPGDLPIFGRVKPSESMGALNISLHQCARDGDESNMRVLLRSLGLNVKKKINQYDEDGLTPLHYAARYNHLSVVKVLVDAGADVQATGPDRITPLHHAVRYRRERITKKKPVAGKTLSGSVPSSPAHEIAPLDEEDERYIKANRVRKNRNVPSLQTVAAAKSEQVLQHIGMNGGLSLPDFQERDPDGSIVRYLVNRGADINARDVYGQTPLHFAAMRGNEVACNNLLFFKDKIKINSSDSQGSTPLHTAAIHKHNEIARMLIEAGASLMSRDKELCTPLHHAATGGSIDLVTLLLDAGFNSNEGWIMLAEMVSVVDIEQNTPLHVAVDHGHYDVVKVLIDKGADVNKERKHFMYPLHLAAQSGDVRIAKLLLENNARIDALNDEQATALHRAAALNHVQVVAFLAEKGAKIINKRDKDNYTPLLLAAFYGNVETVDLLLRKGADYTAVDKYDKTAIFLAAEKNHLNVLTKLLADPRVKRLVNDSDCYDNDPIHIAAQKGYLEVVQLLLKNGAYIDTKNEEELTPLHCAAKYGRTNIVRELIKHDKTIVNHEDENSNTALHVAARYGHHKVAKVLLGLGADVSSRNYNRWTPLDLAASKGWTKTCLVLLNGGSPIDPTDKHKVTSLHLACTYGHARVAEMLIEWGANVGMKDDEGRNCLDRAIENNQVNVAKVIINSTSWKDALRSATRDPITGSVDTPLRKLIKHMPEIAQRVFDRCLSYGHEKNPERPEYEITFDYEFLDDVYAPWIAAVVKEDEVPPSGENAQTPSESNYGDNDDEDDRLPTNAQPYSRDTNILKKNHPLYIMILSERESLLAHPLATSLLQYKWNKFGSFFYYLSFCIYLVFLIFLTGFMISTDPPYMYDNEDTVLIENNTCSSLAEKYKQPPFATGGFYVILILAAFNMLKELLQIYQAKLNYLGWTNLIEWGIYMSAVLLVINFNDCQRATGYRLEWQWNMGAITLFLGWFELVLLIQKFPRFGIYVVMFTDVLHTFSQFFVVFFLFIIAFALAFFTLLQKQFPFETVSKSIIKTSVMLIALTNMESVGSSTYLNELKKQGQELGYSGKELQKFIKEQQEYQEKEKERAYQEQREREERAEKEKERAENEKERAFQLEKLKLEIQVKSETPQIEQKTFKTKLVLKAYDGRGGDIDQFFQNMETQFHLHNIAKTEWLKYLYGAVTHDALAALNHIKDCEQIGYDLVKKQLLEHFGKTEEFYRKEFHNTIYNSKEHPQAFINNLETNLDNWIKMTGIDANNVNAFKELLLVDHVLSFASSQMYTFIKERKIHNKTQLISAMSDFKDSHIDQPMINVVSNNSLNSIVHHQRPRYSSMPVRTAGYSGATCSGCGSFGHWRSQCRSSPRYNNRRHFNKHTTFNSQRQYNGRSRSHNTSPMRQIQNRGREYQQFVPRDTQQKTHSMAAILQNKGDLVFYTCLLDNTPVQCLRDSGCSTLIVDSSLIDASQLTELRTNMQVKQKIVSEEIETTKVQRSPATVDNQDNIQNKSTECHMCATIFTSRNKLFTHIREEHHDPSDSPHMLNVVTRAQSKKEINKTQSTDNIAVGLAVDDIKAVQEQAALKRMAMRVELALDVERLIPHFIRVKAFSRRRTLRPNVTHSNPIRRAFTSSYLSPQALQKALNPELSEIEKVKTNQDRLSSQMRKVKQSVKGVKEQSQKLESMLKAIVKAQKIEWQEEDYQLDEDVELSEDDDGML